MVPASRLRDTAGPSVDWFGSGRQEIPPDDGA
jgi:hypothetical protein